MALNERYAGRAQPTRLETGAAKVLKLCRKIRRTNPLRTAYVLGICVRCSRLFNAGYFESYLVACQIKMMTTT